MNDFTAQIIALVIIILLATLSYFLFRPDFKPEMDFATDSFRAGNEKQAFPIFNKLADEGDPKAQYYLAEMYLEGKGTMKNAEKAIELFKNSAEQGYTNSQYELGHLYMQGDMATQNFLEANFYLTEAAFNNHARAQRLLGQLNEKGFLGEVDLQKAYAWYELASLNGDSFSKHLRDTIINELASDEINEAQSLVETMKAQIDKKTQ